MITAVAIIVALLSAAGFLVALRAVERYHRRWMQALELINAQYAALEEIEERGYTNEANELLAEMVRVRSLIEQDWTKRALIVATKRERRAA